MKRLELVSCQLPRHAYTKAAQEHVELGNRWSYLAVVMDLFSCKPVDWATSHSPNSELTGKALGMTFEARGRPEDVMFHSDQDCHYTSRHYRQLL